MPEKVGLTTHQAIESSSLCLRNPAQTFFGTRIHEPKKVCHNGQIGGQPGLNPRFSPRSTMKTRWANRTTAVNSRWARWRSWAMTGKPCSGVFSSDAKILGPVPRCSQR